MKKLISKILAVIGKRRDEIIFNSIQTNALAEILIKHGIVNKTEYEDKIHDLIRKVV